MAACGSVSVSGLQHVCIESLSLAAKSREVNLCLGVLQLPEWSLGKVQENGVAGSIYLMLCTSCSFPEDLRGHAWSSLYLHNSLATARVGNIIKMAQVSCLETDPGAVPWKSSQGSTEHKRGNTSLLWAEMENKPTWAIPGRKSCQLLNESSAPVPFTAAWDMENRLFLLVWSWEVEGKSVISENQVAVRNIW